MRVLILVLLLGLPVAARAASLDGTWTTGCMAEGEASRITTLILGPESASIRTNLYRDSHCADHKVLEHVQGRYEPAASSLRFIPAVTSFLIYTRQSLAQAYRQHACGIDAWPPMAEQPVSGMDHCLGLAIPRPDVPLMVEVDREGDRLILKGGFGTAGRLHRIEAGDTSRVAAAIAAAKAHMAARWDSSSESDLHDIAAVTTLLHHMSERDQFIRFFIIRRPADLAYSEAEQSLFQTQASRLIHMIDGRNTRQLKEIVAIHGWPRISVFGDEASRNAWLVLQHADDDPEFQHHALDLMAPLLGDGEINKRNYAYIYDRVAMSFRDASRRRPQRYGTQGHCVATGRWEPFPSEDDGRLDERRKDVGLEPMAVYIAGAGKLCN